jgi:sarcosine oxidase delta subunit
MGDEQSARGTVGKNSFVWPASLDQILKENIKRGRKATRAAIERILDSNPSLTRNEIHNRIRKLKSPPRRPPFEWAQWTDELDEILRRGFQEGWSGKRRATNEILKRHPEWPRHIVWRRAIKLGLRNGNSTSRATVRPRRWLATEDRMLLDHAGYDVASTIATLLDRTRNAVRSRLSRLGASSKVSDGYTRTGLASFLHVSPRVVQRWIKLGWLNVRNPRISQASLDSFIDGHADLLGIEDTQSVRHRGRDPGTEYTPNKVAKHFRVERDTVTDWVSRGMLKVVDSHITERSLEDFCQNHSAEIRYEFMPEDARRWLRDSLGLAGNITREDVYDGRSICKHALKVRTCRGCRRNIRGNAYFKHARGCSRLAALERETDDANGQGFSRLMKAGATSGSLAKTQLGAASTKSSASLRHVS